jgi:hypothetical protein
MDLPARAPIGIVVQFFHRSNLLGRGSHA